MNNNVLTMKNTDNMPYTTKALMNRRRRQKQVRRNIIFAVFTIFAALLLTVIFLSFSTQANDRAHRPTYKYFRSIEISSGDTLWSIAKEYSNTAHYRNAKEYIDEVKKINSLTSDRIITGQHIIVPYYSTEFTSTETIDAAE